MKEIIGSSALILGYGREGQSVHRYLKKFYPRVKIGIADQKEVVPAAKGAVRLHTGRGYLRSLSWGYETVIRSPGLSPALPALRQAIKSGVHITSTSNIFFSLRPGMTVGVAGTKGKSTTASLIAQILLKKFSDVRLVGNIGRPALDYLRGASRKKTIFVLELSSHQLVDCRYSPRIAVILDIVPEHLDYYSGFSHYLKAKSAIAKNQTSADYVVFNSQKRYPSRLAGLSPGKKIPLVERQFLPPGLLLKGAGNLQNCRAAAAVGLILEVPPAAIKKALKEFQPLEHRLEFAGTARGIDFYNDSLATVPQSTIHALRALGSRVQTLIAGGFDRGLDFSQLGRFLARRRGLKTLILFPDTGEKIWRAAVKAADGKTALQKFKAESMESAVSLAFRHTGPGKICLLSPASASFNLFKDYDQRGKLFKKLIRNNGE